MRTLFVVSLMLTWLGVLAVGLGPFMRAARRVQMPRVSRKSLATVVLVLALGAAAYLVARLIAAPASVARSDKATAPSASPTEITALGSMPEYPALESLRPRGTTLGNARIEPAETPSAAYAQTSTIRFRGWALEPGASTRTTDVFLLIDGRYRYPGIVAGGNTHEFSLALPLDRVGPGVHTVAIAVISQAGDGYYLLQKPFRFTVVSVPN